MIPLFGNGLGDLPALGISAASSSMVTVASLALQSSTLAPTLSSWAQTLFDLEGLAKDGTS